MLYARVVVGLAVSGPFDYSVPPQLSSKIKIGARVWVNFCNRRTPAYVIGLPRKTGVKNLKSILSHRRNACFKPKDALSQPAGRRLLLLFVGTGDRNGITACTKKRQKNTAGRQNSHSAFLSADFFQKYIDSRFRR